MTLLRRAYHYLIEACAVLGAVLVGAIFVAIIYDVCLRAVGAKPPPWTSAFSEYALLYSTMLAAPWLVRNKAHVSVESLIVRLPAGPRWLVEKLIYLICIALCMGLGYYAALMAVESATRGELDIRSIEIPRWLLFAILPVGFVLCAIEFGRYLFGEDSLYMRQKAPAAGDVDKV